MDGTSGVTVEVNHGGWRMVQGGTVVQQLVSEMSMWSSATGDISAFVSI